MTSREIKASLALRGLTITEVALAICENRANVSQVINYFRATPRIRQKLKKKYRITFDENAELRERAAQRSAA